MHPQFRIFVAQFTAAVLAALAPVVFTAFVTVPLNLQGHPGEARQLAQVTSSHMT